MHIRIVACRLSLSDGVQDDLSTALEAIRGGMAVQKAATEFGIPSGTLYGRCKKVGIELSKNTQVSSNSQTCRNTLSEL